MSKISIDLGHGVGSDRGAVGFIQEETIINEVGNRVIAKLKALGHTVIECRPSTAYSVGNSLSQRVNKANNNNVDLFVSIHANAGGGQGTEVFTYGARQLSQAVNVLNNIVALGFRNRGIKDGSRLAVVKNSNAKAMLIEVCFVDTQSDVNLYRNIGAEKIANAIVKGLVGQTSNISTPNSQPSQPKVENRVSGNDWVRRLQAECNAQGFSNQVVDGIPGVNTLNGCPTLRQGAKGNITRLLQEKLVSLGYNTNGIDGDFGGGTANAVRSFQARNGLSQDAIVGKNTWRKLLGL